MDALFLVLAFVSALCLAGSIVILIIARNLFNRAFDIVDDMTNFAIRLAEQYCFDYNNDITHKEGSV